MKRVLYVKDGVVQNVVGFDDAATIPQRDGGCSLVLDPTGLTNVGDVYDMREFQLDAIDSVMLKELFRLTNAVRALQVPPLPALDAAGYRAFLKTRL